MTTTKPRRGRGIEMSIGEMLERRHEVKLEWFEPWPACGPEGNELDAHIDLRATVHDCINMQRRAFKAAGGNPMGDDAERLLDFIAVHWAQPVKESK